MCCNSSSTTFTSSPAVPLPLNVVPKYEWEGREITALNERLQAIQADPRYRDAYAFDRRPLEYSQEFTSGVIARRVILIAFIVAGMTTFFLFATGHLQTLPQDFIEWTRHINPCHAAVGGGIASLLVGGAIFIIYRATHRKKTLDKESLDKDHGSFTAMDQVLEAAVVSYISEKGRPHSFAVYRDRSAQPNQIYHVKHVADHYIVHAIITLALPLYLIGTVAYNTIRALVIPFYVLIQYCREKLGYRQVEEHERAFELLDAPKEMIKSVIRVVKAPFYILAMFLACLYAFVNPMGGRKLIAAIERDSNEGVELDEGYWSVVGKGRRFRFEGGGGPRGLGRNGFYLAGCDQPAGIRTRDGVLSISEEINSEAVGAYTIKTYSVQQTQETYREGFELIEEMRALREEIEHNNGQVVA